MQADEVRALKMVDCSNQTVLQAIATFPSMHHFDISQSAFKSLKWLHLKHNHVKVLNLSHNNIAFLSWRFVERAPQLLEIDLSFNNLTHLDAKRLFAGAEKLQKLHFAHNSLHSINYNAFSGMTQLKFIDLTGNRFMKVPIFPKTPSLTVIRLDENPIARFDCFHTNEPPVAGVSVHLNWQNVSAFYGDSYCDNKQIRVHLSADRGEEGFFIASDGTYQLDCKANGFKNLRHLIAGHNSFENISEFVSCCGPSMWHLNLSGNRLSTITLDTTFKRFKALKTLFLRDTELAHFDFEWLATLNSLTKLDISNNTNLIHVKNAHTLNGLENLQELNVAGNRIENLMEIIQNSPSTIEKLNVSGNRVKKLNATTFQRFGALRRLNLSDTDLKIDNLNPFAALVAVKFLDISHNSMANVNFTVLSSTLNQLMEFRAANCQLKSISGLINLLGNALEALDLSGNPIKMLGAQPFERFMKLQTLNLSNCSLTYFDADIVLENQLLAILDISYNLLQTINLKRLPTNIRYLNVEGNELSKIESICAHELPALRTLAISRNRLSCDFLKELIRWPKITFVGDPFKQNHGQQCHLDTIHLAAAISMFGLFGIVSIYFGLKTIL